MSALKNRSPRPPTRPLGSSSWRGSRNHQASIGHGKPSRPSSGRTLAKDPRPSQATVSVALSSPVAPSAVRYRTPATLPRSIRKDVASVSMRSRKEGSLPASSASRSSRSHCGTIAM